MRAAEAASRHKELFRSFRSSTCRNQDILYAWVRLYARRFPPSTASTLGNKSKRSEGIMRYRKSTYHTQGVEHVDIGRSPLCFGRVWFGCSEVR